VSSRTALIKRHYVRLAGIRNSGKAFSKRAEDRAEKANLTGTEKRANHRGGRLRPAATASRARAAPHPHGKGAAPKGRAGAVLRVRSNRFTERPADGPHKRAKNKTRTTWSGVRVLFFTKRKKSPIPRRPLHHATIKAALLAEGEHHGVTSTPQELARYARYRKRRRRRLGIQEDRARAAAASRKSSRKNRNEKNEERRAKTSRNAARRKKSATRQPAALAIVTEKQIRLDETSWCGPGAARERQLEKIADAILQKAATSERRQKRSAERDRTPEPSEASNETLPPPETRTPTEIVADLYIRKLRL
jgi:hypothetical protein